MSERKRLPDTHQSITRRLGIVGADPIYVTVGLYDDGKPGEIFIHGQMGEATHGWADLVARLASHLLQMGVPVMEIAQKLRGTRFSPAGFTGDEEFPTVSSEADYLSRWLEKKFGPVLD